jgi:hypothetical protein
MTRIRYSCLLFHLIGSDITVGVEEGRGFLGHCSHGVVGSPSVYVCYMFSI